MLVSKRWFIKKGNRFVGVDYSSGGYPYYTDFWNAKIFNSFEDALSYKQTMQDKNWEICSTDEVGLVFCKEVDAYEVDLAALKKRYGRT